MLPPSVTIKRGRSSGGCAGALRGRRATERAVDAIRVVIVLVFVQLARQVHGVPEKYPIEVLTPDRSDQPFDERMRERSVLNRLDLLDLQHVQIGEPTVKAKERIVIGTKVFWLESPGGGAIEHAAHRHAIQCMRGRCQTR